MSYPERRRVVLTLADIRGVTILEKARAVATAGVNEREVGRLLDALIKQNGSAADLERGVELFYALAWQLERRIDPSLTWADAQMWDLGLALEEVDRIADAEAHASVEAALATGLPPAVAGELTLAQVEAFGTIRAEADKRARRTRRGRRT